MVKTAKRVILEPSEILVFLDMLVIKAKPVNQVLKDKSVFLVNEAIEVLVEHKDFKAKMVNEDKLALLDVLAQEANADQQANLDQTDVLVIKVLLGHQALLVQKVFAVNQEKLESR